MAEPSDKAAPAAVAAPPEPSDTALPEPSDTALPEPSDESQANESQADESQSEPPLPTGAADAPVGKLFVGGISWQSTEQSLAAHFGQFGELVDVALMKNKFTGNPRGFGFVQFSDPVVAAQVVSCNHVVDGRTVDVKPAVPRHQVGGGRNAGPPALAERPAVEEPLEQDLGPVVQRKIFVGGLAGTVTDALFRAYFEQFGEIADAVVMFDRHTLRSRGFGFVTYFQPASVDAVVAAAPHTLNGKVVEVKQAQPRSPHRGGGGGAELLDEQLVAVPYAAHGVVPQRALAAGVGTVMAVPNPLARPAGVAALPPSFAVGPVGVKAAAPVPYGSTSLAGVDPSFESLATNPAAQNCGAGYAGAHAMPANNATTMPHASDLTADGTSHSDDTSTTTSSVNNATTTTADHHLAGEDSSLQAKLAAHAGLPPDPTADGVALPELSPGGNAYYPIMNAPGGAFVYPAPVGANPTVFVSPAGGTVPAVPVPMPVHVPNHVVSPINMFPSAVPVVGLPVPVLAPPAPPAPVPVPVPMLSSLSAPVMQDPLLVGTATGVGYDGFDLGAVGPSAVVDPVFDWSSNQYVPGMPGFADLSAMPPHPGSPPLERVPYRSSHRRPKNARVPKSFA